MSIADELERLDALRKQGVITDVDFDQHKKSLLGGEQKTKSSFFKKKWVRVVIGIVGLLVMINGFATRSSHSKALPACDSSEAVSALKDAVENNAVNVIATLKLLDTKNLHIVSYDSSRNARQCSGTLVLNSGRERVGYELTKSSNGTLLVEVTPVE